MKIDQSEGRRRSVEQGSRPVGEKRTREFDCGRKEKGSCRGARGRPVARSQKRREWGRGGKQKKKERSGARVGHSSDVRRRCKREEEGRRVAMKGGRVGEDEES